MGSRKKISEQIGKPIYKITHPDNPPLVGDWSSGNRRQRRLGISQKTHLHKMVGHQTQSHFHMKHKKKKQAARKRAKVARHIQRRNK